MNVEENLALLKDYGIRLGNKRAYYGLVALMHL